MGTERIIENLQRPLRGLHILLLRIIERVDERDLLECDSRKTNSGNTNQEQ